MILIFSTVTLEQLHFLVAKAEEMPDITPDVQQLLPKPEHGFDGPRAEKNSNRDDNQRLEATKLIDIKMNSAAKRSSGLRVVAVSSNHKPSITAVSDERATNSAASDVHEPEREQHSTVDTTNEVEMDSMPVLKPRKRTRCGQKKRKRLAITLQNGDDDEDNVHDDVLLLKEAQRLRAKAHRAALPQASRSKQRYDTASQTDNDIALARSFAAERSTQEVDEQMVRYIDEKVRQQFGETGHKNATVDLAKRFEDELYAVPDHLRAAVRPLYDPDNGLPDAGVEEIELPDAARVRNERATAAARAKMNRERAKHGNVDVPVAENVAANYVRHRQEWFDARVKDANDTEQSQRTYVRGGGGNKRFEVATDAAAIERFKKRWRNQ